MEELVALRLIYRSYGGENMKDRPAFYSKLLGLVSFLRAAEATAAEVVFVNDGPIPEDRARLMRGAGETVQLTEARLRGSYVAALELATSGRWAPDDVVWFSEDDYLYLPDAFERLGQAADGIPQADYFALYGTTPSSVPERYLPDAELRPPGWRDSRPHVVDGHPWVRIPSTTSSFGARIGVLAEDMGIFRFCMVPHKTMFRDHDTCTVFQGFGPYRWRDVARHALGLSSGPARARLRGVALAPFEAATNLRAHRRSSRRRSLVAADPNLATHMEEGLLAPGTDWARIAEDTLEWGRSRGMVERPSAIA